ncbi:hypothetical protein I3679_016285 [Proteus mirabilis]|uniref:Uncharacterized protein n=1 Tax=Proteus mirabilis TaxID=584 RepID=A0ABD5LY00_PROMI
MYLTGQQQQPLTPAEKAQVEMKQFQKVIDDANGQASLDVIRAYIGLEPLSLILYYISKILMILG